MKKCIHRKSLGCSSGVWQCECQLHGWDGPSDEMSCEDCPDAIWDIDKMDDGELLKELASRVMEWQRGLASINAWSMASKDGITRDEENRVIAEDEAFCRVREILRLVMNDNTIWEC